MKPPIADPESGLQILKGLLRDRSLLTALKLMHTHVGDTFQITLPVFQPVVLVGPDNNRHLLVQGRHNFLWRNEGDPVVHLLQHGVLVTDKEEHDTLREQMDPALHRRVVNQHVADFGRLTDHLIQTWETGQTYDMLVEMRRLALLILMETLFKVDFAPHMDRLWHPILRVLEYISPGFWIVWPAMPRPQYKRALHEVDAYLFDIIQQRRQEVAKQGAGSEGRETEKGDLLTRLVQTEGMSDQLIRDQILTMLIAGHDTSTALLAWVLYLLGKHPEALAQAQAEVDAVVGRAFPTLEHINQFKYLDWVIKETLRLYPPIHIGNRRTECPVQVNGYDIPADTRVMYSIYLSHRHPDYWPEPEAFKPERFDPQQKEKLPPFTYLPFGGGPRNCIGAAFAQVEAKVVLARILQQCHLRLVRDGVKPYMGATLEPRPGVFIAIEQRGGR